MTDAPMTATDQAGATPAAVLERLRAGNARFAAGEARTRDDLAAAAATATDGQFPLVAVLSCIDSRVPVELVFDLGIGDAFVARVAGNVADGHTLGGLEFATELAGTPVIVVLGHTACGAVKGAMAGAELGHLTGLLADITPAVEAVGTDDVAAIVAANVDGTVAALTERSEVLAARVAAGELTIVGAVYDLATGVVTWR